MGEKVGGITVHIGAWKTTDTSKRSVGWRGRAWRPESDFSLCVHGYRALQSCWGLDAVAPPPSQGWIAYPVNRRVNTPKNDDAKLIEPDPA
jgi:hypothetical protein